MQYIYSKAMNRQGLLLQISMIILFSLTSIAQDSTKRSYLGLTAGLSSMKVKDDLVMPVRYQGTNLMFGFNYHRYKPLSSQEVNVESVIGGLKTKEANVSNNRARYLEPRLALYWVDINYVWMRKMPSISPGNYTTYLGASAFFLMNARYNERWDNSQINYDGAFSPLSFYGRIGRTIKTWKKTADINFSLNFPVLIYVIRPEFTGVPDFLDHETDFISNLVGTPASNWTGVWDFPRFKTQLDFSLPIRGENFLKFTYRWEYYSYQDPMRVQYGGHSFLFTLFTRL